MMEPTTVHEQLTELLMDAGCTISKPAVDTLVRWIYVRDTSLIEALQKEGDRIKSRALYQYGLNEKDLKDDSLTPVAPDGEQE